MVGNDTVLPLVPHISATRSGTELSSSSKITASSTAKRIDNKTVLYDYDSKTAIEYSLNYTGFKEDIIVSEYIGQPEYDFTQMVAIRWIIFKTHITYRNMVFTELIDAQILYWMSYYSNECIFIMVQYYSNLLNDEEFHWNTISTQYPDTYDFLKSLNDSLSSMANY